MPAQANLKLNLEAQLSAVIDIGSVQHDVQYGASIVLADGAGANQLTQIFTDQRTLAASASEDLDLNGTLINALGQQVNFTKIRGLIIKASAANVNNVIVGGAAANQFATPFGAAAHTVTVRPGGVLALFAPDATAYGVTAATGDLLKIANSGAGSQVIYDVVLLGS